MMNNITCAANEQHYMSSQRYYFLISISLDIGLVGMLSLLQHWDVLLMISSSSSGEGEGGGGGISQSLCMMYVNQNQIICVEKKIAGRRTHQVKLSCNHLQQNFKICQK